MNKKSLACLLLGLTALSASANISAAEESYGPAIFAEDTVGTYETYGPELPVYNPATLLENAKSHYEAIAGNGGWPTLTPGKTIKPGTQDARIPDIRRILLATGDLKQPLAEGASEEHYDEALQAAVERFQLRHALKVDKAIGKETQTELSVPVEKRIAQIQATLERMQNDNTYRGERYVLVNVPGFYLNAVDQGRVMVNSRVIVGSPKNATPMLTEEITDISFNPSWHVPARIAAEELVVKEKQEPGYLSKKGFVMTDSEGSVVTPEAVDWENASAHEFRFRQPPGSGNALGRIKFNLPNVHNVYLHDTSSRNLFAKQYRALSHGCIRVQETRELAQFALGMINGWDTQKVDRTYDSRTSRAVKLDTPLPVYFVYWPVWTDNNGTVYFHPDIYGKHVTRVAELMQEREYKVAMQ